MARSPVGRPTGHPSAVRGATTPSGLPTAGVVVLLLTLVELAGLIVSLLVLRAWWRTWGPGMREGLADRAEVEKVLGLARIRSNRNVIRPDLYAKSRKIVGRS